MELIIATNNPHKVEEIKASIPKHINVLSLNEVGIHEEIPEEQDTLEGNALQKARYIYEKYGKNCFADDTGLEVEALGNAPGVFSARYAGAACNAQDNIKKLLGELRGSASRAARFRTVIALIINGEQHLFEGEVKGTILEHQQGAAGFGYDPVFQPEGYENSFAEMPSAIKNQISHRGRAVQALLSFLKTSC